MAKIKIVDSSLERLKGELAALQQQYDDGEDVYSEYMDKMQELADANRAWRVQEEEAGRRTPGIIAEVND